MTPPRFSTDELVDIINVTRLRSTVTRDSGPDHDGVDLQIPHMPGCAYRFSRDKTGWTYLIFTDPDQSKLLVAGTLAECLGLLEVQSLQA